MYFVNYFPLLSKTSGKMIVIEDLTDCYGLRQHDSHTVIELSWWKISVKKQNRFKE